MKYFLSILFIFSLNLVSPLLAQDKSSVDMSALLENKIWKVQLPKDKHYAMEMEFRSAGWKQTFLYDEKQTEICDSYSLHEDTIKSFQKNYIIQELTDSTLVLQYLPESLKLQPRSIRLRQTHRQSLPPQPRCGRMPEMVQASHLTLKTVQVKSVKKLLPIWILPRRWWQSVKSF